ncbi:MAG: GAF domain-containing protein [Vicinamibacterales bacterium]
MLQMAHERQAGAIPRLLVDGIAADAGVVLVRLWLLGRGDVCATCRMAGECGNRETCLHLVASAGNPSGGGAYARLDGDFRRFPLGRRKIGEVAATATPILVRHLRGDEAWLVNPGWASRQGVRTFAAHPLVYRGDVLGVIALFDRETLGEEHVGWLRLLADHAAVSIANARAFEVATAALSRLEAENASLRAQAADGTAAAGSPGGGERAPMTRDELRQLERQNIARALEASGGRVFGANGAAARLGMKPTTLASRIKVLGLGRTRA